MKYCLKYNQLSQFLNQADEIAIKYMEDKGLVSFLEKFSSKRIILLIDEKIFSMNEVRKLIAIRQQYPEYDFTVSLLYYSKDIISLLRPNNIPFYISEPCCNWETLNLYVDAGVSDVVIGGELGFMLRDLHQYIEKLDRRVYVRAIVNKSTNQFKETNPLKGFYIRPEDIDKYEGFIDVVEFYNSTMQDLFYSIYHDDKIFLGSLNQIIYGVFEDIDNKSILPSFADRRLHCGRGCLKGRHCRFCDIVLKTANKIEPYIEQQIKTNIQQASSEN